MISQDVFFGGTKSTGFFFPTHTSLQTFKARLGGASKGANRFLQNWVEFAHWMICWFHVSCWFESVVAVNEWYSVRTEYCFINSSIVLCGCQTSTSLKMHGSCVVSWSQMAGFKLLKKKRDALKAKFQVWTPNRKKAAEIVRCGKVTKTNTHFQLQLVGHFFGWNKHVFLWQSSPLGGCDNRYFWGTLEGNCGHQAEGAF